MNQLKNIRQRTEGALPALTLVLVSIISAAAAIFGLQNWVAIAAAVAAVLSGAQVINRSAVIPWRMKSANNAVARVYEESSEVSKRLGSAVQITPRRWVTAAHAVTRRPLRRQDHRDPAPAEEVSLMELSLKLRLGNTFSRARVIYRHEELDLAVMESDNDWPWLARISMDLPEPGTSAKVVGWTDDGDHGTDIRLMQDCTVQGSTEDSLIVLVGAAAPWGFSGAAVIDISTGRVFGIAFASRPGGTDDRRFGASRPDETHVIPLSCIPSEHIR
ncbi:serine protease [Streptomyces sp. NPDC057307]|uniref:S1 family peptidase n=1 Tax=Streptomyces sp. NPDC057307 TaxID=3346096 RepID=UPI00363AF917